MDRAIVVDKLDISAIHGGDGFGGAQKNWIKAANMDNIQTEHAVNGIIKHVNEEHAKGNIVGIFTIGPMSNLAMAIRLDPSIIDKISKVYVMGGTVHGWGNITLTGEYNFRADPEAAKICISSFKNIHLLPWETAYNFQVTEEGTFNTPQSRVLISI
jgi:purine nucleosidase